MKRVRLSRQAEADILDVFAFIAQDNVRAADRFVDLLDRKFKHLARNPHIGRARPEIGRKVRTYHVGTYLVVYRPSPQGVDIARVVSGFRNLGPHDVES